MKIRSLKIVALGVVAAWMIARTSVGGDPPPPAGLVQNAVLTDNITSLAVKYGTLGNEPKVAYPGYLSEDGACFYQWRGVVIDIALVPPEGNISGDRLMIDLSDPKLKFYLCDPPVRMIELADGKFGLAYYDHSSKRLFRWAGVNIDFKRQPAGAALPISVKDYDLKDVPPSNSDEIEARMEPEKTPWTKDDDGGSGK